MQIYQRAESGVVIGYYFRKPRLLMTMANEISHDPPIFMNGLEPLIWTRYADLQGVNARRLDEFIFLSQLKQPVLSYFLYSDNLATLQFY